MIEQTIIATFPAAQAVVPVTLRYSVLDPLQVIFVFNDGEQFAWMVSRDLLRQVLRGDLAGEGDVQLTPFDDGRRVLFRMSNGFEHATLVFLAKDLKRFVGRSHAVVPFGKEPIDVDGFLAELFKEPA